MVILVDYCHGARNVQSCPWGLELAAAARSEMMSALDRRRVVAPPPTAVVTCKNKRTRSIHASYARVQNSAYGLQLLRSVGTRYS